LQFVAQVFGFSFYFHVYVIFFVLSSFKESVMYWSYMGSYS